jgi:purine nucleosidase
MALRHPDAEVLAITVVAGNVGLEQGIRNVLFTVELCGASTPVFAGARRPLLREPVDASWFHGCDGLGDRGYPPPQGCAGKEHAVDVLIDRLRSHPGAVLVTLGPLTNLALALSKAPDIAQKVGRCVIMGGAPCTVGNVTPAAEYNIWCDPEAARIVFHSGLPIEMVGWELCRGEANLKGGDQQAIRRLDTPLAHFVLDCNQTAIEANRRQSGDSGLALPDPIAMSIALDPSVCIRKSCHFVEIETASPLTRGMTVVDALNVAGDERNRAHWGPIVQRPPNASICWRIDIPAWKRLLVECLQ